MPSRAIESFMTRHPHSVRAGESVATAVEIMLRANCHHLPVLDGGKLVGVISDRDMRLIPHDDQRHRKVEDVCIDEPITVDVDTSTSTAAAIMADKRMSSVLVTDQGKLVGIFTSTDACRALAELGQ